MAGNENRPIDGRPSVIAALQLVVADARDGRVVDPAGHLHDRVHDHVHMRDRRRWRLRPLSVGVRDWKRKWTDRPWGRCYPEETRSATRDLDQLNGTRSTTSDRPRRRRRSSNFLCDVRQVFPSFVVRKARCVFGWHSTRAHRWTREQDRNVRIEPRWRTTVFHPCFEDTHLWKCNPTFDTLVIMAITPAKNTWVILAEKYLAWIQCVGIRNIWWN